MADNDQTERPGRRERDFERALGGRPAPQEILPEDNALNSASPFRARGGVFDSAKKFMAKSGAAVQSLKERRAAMQPASNERIIADAPRDPTAAARAAAAAAALRLSQPAQPVAPASVSIGSGARTAYAASSPAAVAAAVRPRRERGLTALFGPGADTLLGLTAALFTLFVGGWIAKDWLSSRSMDKSGLQRIIAKKWNERTLVFPIEGADAQGRRALFDVVVLTKNYGWVKGSTTELERGETRLSAEDIEQEVLAPQLREGLSNARELIAVGLASQEGDVEREEQRGGLRASRIASWVRGAIDPNIPMWTLNLGRYLEPCAECEEVDTSWQRPFIVIANRQTDPGTNISEALKSAMSDKVNLPSPSRYSAWALAKFEK